MDLAGIRHIAQLAELELSPSEEERFASELGRILAYVAELSAIDTSNIAPTAHVLAAPAPLRADVPEEGLSQEQALAAAPQPSHGGFRVPTFVES
jgi:aspartyl-tRNA(Asn)/glutamyl-tRNA(Gln) amidotransferase subunit C